MPWLAGAAVVLGVAVVLCAAAIVRCARRTDPRPAEVIVVLGARVLDTGAPSPALRARVARGVALLEQGMGRRLLFSGRGRGPRPEAEVALELAVAWGVAAERCWLELESDDTWENAQRTAALLRPHGIEQVLLVSDPEHLLRARQCFLRAGLRPIPCAREVEPGRSQVFLVREAVALLLSPRLWAPARRRDDAG